MIEYQSSTDANRVSKAQRLRNLFETQDALRNLRLANDNLRRQLFTMDNKMQNLAEKSGFPTFDTLYNAVDASDIKWVWNKVAELQAEPSQSVHGDVTAPSAKLSEDAELISAEHYAINACDSESNIDDLRTALCEKGEYQFENETDAIKLRHSLHVLTKKYAALVTAKENVEQKYKEDYIKWRSFKDWLVKKIECSQKKHMKSAKGLLGNASREKSNDIEVHSNSNMKTASKRTMEQLNLLGSMFSHSDLAGFQGVLPDMTNSCNAINELERPSERKTPDALQSSSSIPSPRDRTKCEGSPIMKSTCKCDVQNSEEKCYSCKPTENDQYPKQHLRNTINAAFEIDPALNDGLTFQFEETVRGRENRRRLPAGACSLCKDYYDQILPNVSNETSVLFWRSPTSSGTREDVEQISCACNSTEKHKQQVSRHRHQWAPPSTPPDYWSIGFPTTQEVANINKRAEDMHVDKRRRIENETSTGKGRYTEKAA